jgi:hypothetical protein
MVVYTYHDLIREREKERLNGAFRENYRLELYQRYTGKDPAAIVYNGFRVTRPDGSRHYYTIHYRTDNTRPYAVYHDGSQTRNKTYIKRFYLEKLLKQLADQIKRARPGDKIDHLHGVEIIT